MDENKNLNPDNATEELETVEVHYKELSPARMVARRFFRSRLSLIGVILLVVLFVFAFAGPPVMHMLGYQWSETATDHSPTVKRATTALDVKTVDAQGNQYEVIQFIEEEVGINSYAPLSSSHLLGTDEKGMDVFIRLMYGGRISLTLGFVVVILETIIGIIMGGIAGYFGGKADQIIMRLVDVLNCIPMLPILLIASVVIDSWQIESSMRIYYLMLIMTVFGWSGIARMVRGQILYLREQEYIVACEVMGIPVWRRIFKHLVPNIMPQLIVSMTLGLGSIILYESSTDPVTMAFYPNLWIPAGILIVVAVLAFNFVGDGLRDAMDPKSKR